MMNDLCMTATTNPSVRTAHTRPKIMMLGPESQAPGGMSAVLKVYENAGLADQWPIVYCPTWRVHRVKQRWLFRLPLRWLRIYDFARALGLLWWALQTRQVQAVHAHSAARGSFWRKSFMLQCAGLYRKSTLLHIHDGSFIQWYEGLNGIAQYAVRQTLKSCTSVIVLTPYWARAIAQIEPQAATTVLPNPVPIPISMPHEAVFQFLGDTPKTLLFMGRLWLEKGIDELLETVATLRYSFPDVQLVLAGDGEYSYIRDRAKTLGIADRVILPGWVSGEAKQMWLRQAYALVLPSLAEGMPMAILEAMAMGIPVVATAVGGIPDMLAQGGGLTYVAGDRAALHRLLAYLLRNPRQAQQMGRRGHAVAQALYAAPKIVEQLGALYELLGLRR
jgi:glycosyltransferase involved in cell wall biosynthesis